MNLLFLNVKSGLKHWCLATGVQSQTLFSLIYRKPSQEEMKGQMLFHFLLLPCSAFFIMVWHISPKEEKCRCWLRHYFGYRACQSGLGQDFQFCGEVTGKRERDGGGMCRRAGLIISHKNIAGAWYVSIKISLTMFSQKTTKKTPVTNMTVNTF